MRLSLRTQLILWFGLGALVIIFVVTLVAEEVLVWNMGESIDDALRKRTNMVAAIISSDITPDETSYVRVMNDLTQQELPFAPLLLRLTSPNGAVIVQFGQLPDYILASLNDNLTLPNLDSGHFDSLTLHEGEELRVYTVSVSDPATHQTLAFVQAVESLRLLDEVKRGLWRNAFILGMGGASVAILAGLFLIQRGLRPLGIIIRTINKMDYNNLKTRLREENRPLELQQLARSLTEMWQRLDTEVSQKQTLLRIVSHDLRTPLTSLKGHLEVLLMDPTLVPDVRDSLQRMLEETGRLIRMVRNLLLNITLESAPKLIGQDVSLRLLLDEVIADTWVLAKGLQLEISAPADIFVHCDRDLLKQMLLNIIDNAIKFTPQDGKLTLGLSVQSDWAVVEVSDTGVGIPSEVLPHVTEPFYNSKSSSRHGGVGVWLGLSIVKQIAELHGGHLEIRSVERVGTSVQVRLPLSSEPSSSVRFNKNLKDRQSEQMIGT